MADPRCERVPTGFAGGSVGYVTSCEDKSGAKADTPPAQTGEDCHWQDTGFMKGQVAKKVCNTPVPESAEVEEPKGEATPPAVQTEECHWEDTGLSKGQIAVRVCYKATPPKPDVDTTPECDEKCQREALEWAGLFIRNLIDGFSSRAQTAGKEYTPPPSKEPVRIRKECNTTAGGIRCD